jgi:putative selenium metabolism hydrolase
MNFDAMIAFTQSLVQVETLPGNEKPAIDLVQAEMTRLGYDQVHVDENGSVIGMIAGGQPGPTLLFDAHCDTVGIAPGVAWDHDPFGAVIQDDRLYGRGSADMKGPVAAMLFAAASIDQNQINGRVVVSISVLEEVLEGFALRTVMDVVQPDFVVIGEPTDLNLAHGGRGRAEIHLNAIGKPAHSSSPHLGVNAVHRMIPAIQAMEKLPMQADAVLGPGVMALTDIISEPYPSYSVIPSRCHVVYDRRLLAGETSESVLAEINALPEMGDIQVTIGVGEYTAYTGTILRGPKCFPAWKLDTNHDFVQAAFVGLKSAGLNPSFRAYQFCTNAAYSAGVAGVPTIGFGPSPESRAHIVDEYIGLADLKAAARGYQGIIRSVLGVQ